MQQIPLLSLRFPGGINENETPNLQEAAKGSFNFELSAERSALIPRPPFDLVGTASNAANVSGIGQLVKTDNTQTTIVAAGTVVYAWDGATAFTSKATGLTAPYLMRDVTWDLGNYSLLTDVALNNVLKKWDGSTFADATTGLGGTALYAKYGLVKDGRVWLFNVKAGTATPHLMVASKFEDPTVFDISKRATDSSFTTGLEAFYMVTPDLKAISGAVLFQNTLVISTQGGRLFQLTGNNSKNYAWIDFYDGSAAIGDESIVNTGNDVMYMRKGGNISTLAAVQSFGDVKADDFSRWLSTTIKNLTGCLCCYDQTNAKVYFFVSGGKVLVFFKDKYFAVPGQSPVQQVGLSPWSVYMTAHASNFSPLFAKYMYAPGTTQYGVYFGDQNSTGNIYLMNGVGAGDAGSTPIQLKRISRLIDKDVIQQYPYDQRILQGVVQYRRKAPTFDFTVEVQWSDEYNTSSSVIRIPGPPISDTGVFFGGNFYFGGNVYFNQGFQFAETESHQTFSPTGVGPSFVMTLSAANTGQWQVDSVDTY